MKDSNGKLDDSNNYRGIGIGSLMLKILDWVVLDLHETELTSDPNQFGFQEKSSTTMCSWTVIEIVNYFKNQGSEVFACLLDYRKAFDLVNHQKLFKILIKRKVRMIFIRIMIFIYIEQKCYVKWNGTRSYSFGVTNGTRQGSVFSPKGGFSSYLDPLLECLRESGYGCQIGLHWYGALAYADDVILLSTSVHGLQQLVNICMKHAQENNLLFSTDPNLDKSKTMCIAFNCKKKDNLSKIFLNNDLLPWKVKAKHIGNYLNEDGTMDTDVKVKRAEFIDTCMNLNNEFEFLVPENQVRVLRLYNSHFTGSSTWRFSSEAVRQLWNSWIVNLHVVFGLPMSTHCWIVERLEGGTQNN